MSQIIEASDEEPLGDLAANLIALAKARGIPGPKVVTHLSISAFEVSDELYEAWQGAPDPASAEKSPVSEPEGEEKPAKSRKSRKGDK